MIKSILHSQSPIVKLFFLLVLSIGGLSVFLFFAALMMKLIWGISFLSDPSVLENLSDPYIVDANRFMLIFQHIGFFILPSLVFLYVGTKDPRNFILWKRQFQFSTLFIVVGILLFLAPFVNLLISWNEAMHLPDFLSSVEANMRLMEDSAGRLTDALVSMNTPNELIYMIFIVAVLPAIGEELMFRGIVQRLLSQQFKSYHIGIWITALLFSALHFQFFGFFPRVFLGAVLGYLLIFSGNIIYPMIAHFFNNFSSLVLAYMIQHKIIGDEIETIGGQQEWLYILPGLIVSGLLFYFLWRKRSVSIGQEYIERNYIEGAL